MPIAGPGPNLSSYIALRGSGWVNECLGSEDEQGTLCQRSIESGCSITLPCLRRVQQDLFAPQSSRNQITLPGVPPHPLFARTGGQKWPANADFTRRFDLERLRFKSKCARSHSRQSAKQASRLRFVRDLRGGAAEHPRSYGTAGAQLVKFVV